MKKSLLVFLAVLAFSAALFAQYTEEKKIEFSIMGGYGLGSLDGTSMYSDDWGTFWVPTIHEQTDIALTNKNTFSLGANISYFFTPNFGIQFGGGYFAPKADVNAAYTFHWENAWHPDETVTGSWPVTEGAKLTSIPLYLNLIAKYNAGTFGVYATAGPTLFIEKFNADSYSIYGDDIWSGWYLDYFQIPITIPDTSWTGFGFNVGAGVELNISPSVAFVVEARYFYAPKKDFAWTWVTGIYNGIDYTYDGGDFQNWHYTDFSTAESKTTVLTVNPSFFTIMGGFKFFF
jgi:opacity protein-like surface antigen